MLLNRILQVWKELPGGITRPAGEPGTVPEKYYHGE